MTAAPCLDEGRLCQIVVVGCKNLPECILISTLRRVAFRQLPWDVTRLFNNEVLNSVFFFCNGTYVNLLSHFTISMWFHQLSWYSYLVLLLSIVTMMFFFFFWMLIILVLICYHVLLFWCGVINQVDILILFYYLILLVTIVIMMNIVN